ncbi:hypothetical protein KMZ29_16870 [Bradyrhizobium sediminis]|uniref:Uncharacterized protein n=1 Tax=Bradyrhizobium sediminis TaxID=2840469 RepID=A0A975NAV3_9BRAD|nr:hypothetical protein [Bradyrhizobium sediminis]QWG11405.1 hypothetical protein KMZ29_16870 [Bradyrhizobium sediminis]
MRRAKIEEENNRMVRQQREFRVAADVVTKCWMVFPEVEAIAVIGSVAKPLWKEVPRFSEFRKQRVEIWHECGDLDLALWIDSLHRLGELRRARDRALRDAFESGVGISVANHQVDVFLFEPQSDRYLGRLCSFNQCPKRKPPCFIAGCGAIPFNKQIADFVPRADLLASAAEAMLYRRGSGVLRSALELPSIEARQP